MTASPTDAGMPGDVGLPSEEEIARAMIDTGINIGASTWPDEQFRDAQEIARAILSRIRPAFEAKEREIEELKGKLAVQMEYLVGLAMTADKYACAAAERRALSAEAKLAQAVEDEREACATIAEDYPAHEHRHLDADPHYAAQQAAHEVAGAIRARSASARQIAAPGAAMEAS